LFLFVVTFACCIHAILKLVGKKKGREAPEKKTKNHRKKTHTQTYAHKPFM
jgi:Na+-transporting methylmalonyl-CoA/oxaloacetate decarboxylase gamma subunit